MIMNSTDNAPSSGKSAGIPVVTVETSRPLFWIGSLLMVGLALLVLHSHSVPHVIDRSKATSQILPWITPGQAPNRKNWTVTFSDEFAGNTLDHSKWQDSYPGGKRTHSNNEQEYYTPENVHVAVGRLYLAAERRSVAGMPYASGLISSYGAFSQRYGWFEIGARLPRGQGLWPAFRLLPADGSWPPEIDVLDAIRQAPRRILLSHHWSDPNGQHKWITQRSEVEDTSQEFHTFAADWEPDHISWYMDGMKLYEVHENIPTCRMYILANLAVGGDLPGMPDATTHFPATMAIEYIRVWQRKDRM